MADDGGSNQDPHFAARDVPPVSEYVTDPENTSVYDAIEEDQGLVEIGPRDTWPQDEGGDHDGLIDVNDPSIFYPDFPPLPEFPCISSSSSSPSTPAASRPPAATSSADSSSPVISWPIMRSNPDEGLGYGNPGSAGAAALSSTASMEIPPPSGQDNLDGMENLEYIDLMDPNEIWDPSSLFQNDNPPQELEEDPLAAAPAMDTSYQDENDGFASFLQGNSELSAIFFEWLKQNRDYVSAEDMRSIKLRRSTIESATRRLGTSWEGKKQLLKLILEWVAQYQLQKRWALHNPGPNPNPSPNFIYTHMTPMTPMTPDPNACYSSASPWMLPPAMPEMAYGPPTAGFGSDPYGNPTHLMPMTHHQVANGIPYPHPHEYPTMDSPQPWPMPPSVMPMAHPHYGHYPENVNSNVTGHQQGVYGNNTYNTYDANGRRLVRLDLSATKEARKKRMARQRRMYGHHHRHGGGSGPNHGHMGDGHGEGEEGGEDGVQTPGNWAYWAAGGGSGDHADGDGPPGDGDRAARLAGADRRQQQGWKGEKNLKFLLQKVLKQSDVGNLGRIVLPKKEAESHLPELETRDGITISMEDIGTSRVWNMRYRFWPNNKSRMYLLENTGDFVRFNGLQEGDFIVIYSDTKCGKYMIRGVKVPQPGTKPEGKKPAKKNMRNLSSLAGRNIAPLAPIKQAIM